MSKRSRKVFIICSEGDAEENLFAYLKNKYNSSRKFFKAVPLGGFDTLVIFENKYKKLYRGIGLKKNMPLNKVSFVFIIDNDLDDSVGIIEFIKKEGHKVQICDKNVESVLLRLNGFNLKVGTALPEYRKLSKAKFKSTFNKEAHEMKDIDFDKIFDDKKFKDSFPVLHEIFNT